MRYRKHKGGLKESLETEVQLESKEALFDYVRQEHAVFFDGDGKITVEWYAHDRRPGCYEDTYIVCVDGMAVGYTDGLP